MNIRLFGRSLTSALVRILFLTGLSAVARSVAAAPAVEIVLRVDLGEDLGQNFGSLFEAHTEDGAYTLGAGFLGLYNTYYREDRHAVHFFVRPARGARDYEAQSLPRPNDLAGVYLFARDGRLYAADPEAAVWDPEAGQWAPDAQALRGRLRLGKELLLFGQNRVDFNGNAILAAPEEGDYSRFYYALGRLFFYHTFRAGRQEYRPYQDDASGYTKLYACPWKPGEGAVDLSKAVVATLPFVGENPFSYGQLGKDVLTCSNIGGLYAFDGTSWRTIVEGELETSYQVYSMLNFQDRLLMGQYPTGELFSFDGKQTARLEGWPPRMPGVSGSAREAQTTTIYGGELFTGVWPWGELWRYHPDEQNWSFVRRMFARPPVTAATTHPYEKECAALGGVANQWGQRVTSLIPLGPDLIVSTSAKWPCPWEPKFCFVGEGAWQEYGAVTRLSAPGHLSAPLAWREGEMELRFVLEDGAMRILQDGNEAGRTHIGSPLEEGFSGAGGIATATWGQGIYGAYGGKTLEGEIRAPSM